MEYGWWRKSCWEREKQAVPDCHIPLLYLLEKWLETPLTLCYV